MSLWTVAAGLLLNSTCRVQATTVTLTNDQIKALPTTPQTIIAAPAAGFRIGWFTVDMRMNNTAGAYTNVNAAGSLSLHYDASPSELASLELANDTVVSPDENFLSDAMGAVESSFAFEPRIYIHSTRGALVVPRTVPESLGLMLVADNDGSGDFTGGHANNTWTLNALYLLEEA